MTGVGDFIENDIYYYSLRRHSINCRGNFYSLRQYFINCGGDFIEK